MAKTRLPYPPQFRRQLVELVHAGRTPEELAAEFEPTAQSIGTGLLSLRAMRAVATAA